MQRSCNILFVKRDRPVIYRYLFYRLFGEIFYINSIHAKMIGIKKWAMNEKTEEEAL